LCPLTYKMKIGNTDLGNFPLLLAPMEDITDPPFRLICRELGASAVVTEFIAADGLIRDVVKSIKKLEFSQQERPVGIQLFGSYPEAMVQAAKLAEEANPDFIDINFGCPVRKIVNKGGGAALLKDIPLLLDITRQVVRAVNLPVTVKTRLGWDDNSKNIVELAEQLQDLGIKALTIHGRTRAQLYSGKADWTLIGEVKKNPRMYIPIIGNGDITGIESAINACDRYGVDGIMIGRAAVGNPWLFRDIRHFLETGNTLPEPGLNDRINLCKRHLEESVKWKGEISAVLEIRRHYPHYFKGLPDFKPFRMRLMTTTSYTEVLDILDEIRKKYDHPD